MRRHQTQTSSPQPSLRAAVLDVAGGIALFVLLFAVLHLPIMT